jgi:hypothetical protein
VREKETIKRKCLVISFEGNIGFDSSQKKEGNG